MTDSLQEILLIDKPSGITSFDVIRILRKKMRIRKMGHAGTLDPMATGLMIVGIGKGTKKLNEYLKLDKVYEAEVLLGILTDTGDVLGKVLEEDDVPPLEEKALISEVQLLKGVHALPVPIYSAVKRAGRPLYSYARNGEAISPPVKEMEVLDVDFISFNDNRISLRLEVRSGTYIRSIAELLGRKLNTLATLSKLRRLSIGDFSVENAETLLP